MTKLLVKQLILFPINKLWNGGGDFKTTNYIPNQQSAELGKGFGKLVSPWPTVCMLTKGFQDSNSSIFDTMTLVHVHDYVLYRLDPISKYTVTVTCQGYSRSVLENYFQSLSWIGNGNT